MSSKLSPWRDVCGQGKDSAYGGIRWEDAATIRQCDPYLVWLDITSRERVNGPRGPGLVPLLLEVEPGSGLNNPDIEMLPMHTHAAGYRFVPTVVFREELRELHANTGEGKPFRRYELCAPRFASAADLETFKEILFQLTGSRKLSFGFRPLADDLPVQGGVARAAMPSKVAQREYDEQLKVRSGVVLAVVDDGCNFAAPGLAVNDAFGVRSIWHQSTDAETTSRLDEPSSGWTAAYKISQQGGPQTPRRWRGALFGRFLRVDKQGAEGLTSEELSEYEFRRYPRRIPRWSHGSAVMDAIAQRGRVQTQQPGTQPLNVRIAFAQLPPTTISDTSGGSLSCHVLEAIHDALDEAGDSQVVVNLSYGNYSGSHDGSSLFERGLQELLCSHDNLHVVLPAGNGHLTRTHAAGRAVPKCAARLRWKVQPDNADDVHLQLWFREPHRVSIDLVAPGGERLSALRCGEARVWQSGQGSERIVHAAAIFPQGVPQGMDGSMCLVCIGPSRARLEGLPASHLDRLDAPDRWPSVGPHGVWTIEIRSVDESGVDFHAWIQRADEAPARWMGDAGHIGRQGYFLDDPIAAAGTADAVADVAADPRFTLNAIATFRHDRLWVVGSMRRCDGGLSSYSAAGPGANAGVRCAGPDVVVPADESLALPGLRVAGFLGSSRVRVSGTSIAAGVLAGELCQHLACGGSADTFCFWPESDHRERPMAAAGEPERAPPGYRGSGQRWLTTAPTSLRGQCPEEDCGV